MRLLFASILFAAGCAAGPPMVRSDGTVMLGDWCERTTREMCSTLARQCFPGMNDPIETGCRETAAPRCLAGRDSLMSSGRKPEELQACLAMIGKQTCESLGAGVGNGSLAAACAVKPPAGQ